MAWNEPPKGDDKDPWGNKRKQNDGPPDLDELFKSLNKKLNQWFGGSNNNQGSGIGMLLAAIIVLAAFLGYDSVYIVDAQEEAVVLRLGKYNETQTAGLNWKIPFIDSVTKVNVSRLESYRKNSEILTKDENIVNVEIEVQYRAEDPMLFVLSVQNPAEILRLSTESAKRHVVGTTSMDEVISTGRERFGIEVKERLQKYLDDYQTGIQISKVTIEDVKPPSQVEGAYQDVIKAKEDEIRLKNQADAYRNEVVPIAEGKAIRQIQDAEAYKAKVVSEAQGDASRFLALYNEYKLAPEVTKDRMRLDTLSRVYEKSSKVIMDVEGGNNMMYLPLDQLIKNRPAAQ